MSPTRRQLLQGIAALAVAPSQAAAPVASPWADDSEWFDQGDPPFVPVIFLAEMPIGWDAYDDLDRELMAQGGPNGWSIGYEVPWDVPQEGPRVDNAE